MIKDFNEMTKKKIEHELGIDSSDNKEETSEEETSEEETSEEETSEEELEKAQNRFVETLEKVLDNKEKELEPEEVEETLVKMKDTLGEASESCDRMSKALDKASESCDKIKEEVEDVNNDIKEARKDTKMLIDTMLSMLLAVVLMTIGVTQMPSGISEVEGANYMGVITFPLMIAVVLISSFSVTRALWVSTLYNFFIGFVGMISTGNKLDLITVGFIFSVLGLVISYVTYFLHKKEVKIEMRKLNIPEFLIISTVLFSIIHQSASVESRVAGTNIQAAMIIYGYIVIQTILPLLLAIRSKMFYLLSLVYGALTINIWVIARSVLVMSNIQLVNTVVFIAATIYVILKQSETINNIISRNKEHSKNK